MTRIIAIDDIMRPIHRATLKQFMLQLVEQLRKDFARWDEFDKSPRHATYYPHGVIELMPISDHQYYAYKYVNGHPNNPKQHKQTVVATGQLSSVETGYPILISEMTLLTAFRTAATSALSSQYLAPKNNRTFGIIGTGAQSEFQTLAHHFALEIDQIYYFDLDEAAMDKFEANLRPYPLTLHRCQNAKEVIDNTLLITTATASKANAKVIESDWIAKGCHLNKIGGDAPGKTELDPHLLKKAKIVVELPEQTKVEGEIQQLSSPVIYACLWELAAGKKPGRTSQDEITLFDSVGFALEDYSVLRLVHQLVEEYGIGHQLEMVPHLPDPKNLFSTFTVHH